MRLKFYYKSYKKETRVVGVLFFVRVKYSLYFLSFALFTVHYDFSPWYYLHNKCSKSSWLKVFGYIQVNIRPMLNVHKTLTWSSWHQISALCTFSLDSMSIGISFVTLKKSISWELIFTRLVFVCINVRKFRNLLTNLRKFVPVKFVLFSYLWK